LPHKNQQKSKNGEISVPWTTQPRHVYLAQINQSDDSVQIEARSWGWPEANHLWNPSLVNVERDRRKGRKSDGVMLELHLEVRLSVHHHVPQWLPAAVSQ
jgi:hypothetical protein